MIKKLYLPLLMALVVALSSCNKKMGELSSDYFTTTPQVLEAVAGKVPVTINGKFPEKYFNKKAVVEVTPVLRWNGGEAKGQPAVFQGEKVEGNDQTISYKVGGNYTMKTSFDYVPEMAKSELYLEFNVMFLIQQANIRASELKTAKEFNKEVAEVNEAANKKISNIEVSAYASPDGGVKLNTGLAENRESNTTKMLSKDLKKAKVDAPIDSKYTAQDWEGFQELVSKSNIQDKELILRVLSMYQDPEQREQEIKNISSVYKTLADEILPQLRRSRLTLNYEIIGKSDDEIASLAASNPKELTLEELLYAATLTNDNGKKEVIYTKATELFPNDYRAFNNLGKLAYQAGNIDKAESYLKKAANIQAAPEVNMNLGLVALAKGDKNAAEAYLGKAAGAKELGETLGNLYIAQGQYERAVNSFGDAKTNSAALAQILAKDYNKAKNTLANIEKPDAYTDYLMAVLGARTNNQSMLTSSLKNAVAKDSSLAKKAATDLEFAKYFTNSAFMNIIK